MTRGQIKSDALRLALLMGLCSAIGVYLIATTVLITKDGVFYIEQAWRIGQDPLAVCRRYPPGYPFLVWAGHEVARLFAREDSATLWAYSAQGVTLLCRVLTLIPLYVLGRCLVGAANGFWALLVLIILPYPAFYGSDVLREWPYLLFLSTGMLLLYRGLTTRRWWLLALVGLDAGLGYLIRPECAQLIVYAALGLAVMRHRSCEIGQRILKAPRFGIGLLLLAGFAVPAVPYVYASRGIIPHQLRPSTVNLPPVIHAVGSETAANHPLEFEVREGELLELPIRTTDPDDDRLAFSLASIPLESRPVYRFRSATTGAPFWTVSEQERERLVTDYPEVWICEGIDWYAYPRPDARPGLQPVYRFWSLARQRHFYTMSESEKEAILANPASDPWTYEGPMFYAFPEGNHPADATAVYRFWDEQRGYAWDLTLPPGTEAEKDTVAWYAHLAGEPPAGAGTEGGVFRWRPQPGQAGDYQVIITVADEELACWQLAIIHVTGAGSTRRNRPMKEMGTDVYYAATYAARRHRPLTVAASDLYKLATGMKDIFSALGDNFMFIPMLPWILGLYRHLRYRARGGLERVLIPALLIANAGLMLGRSLWFEPGSDRRYSLAMIALTIFYLPTGLDAMTRALNRVYTFRGRPAAFGSERRSLWFYLLLLGVVVLCAPKLIFRPLRADKAGLRAAGEWLRRNTPVQAVIAIPDNRVCFYAERRGLFYERYPNWRRASYVVAVTKGDATQKPAGWKQAYSTPLGRGDDRTVIIYDAVRASE